MSHFDALTSLAALHRTAATPAHVGADATTSVPEPISTSTIVGFAIASFAIPMAILMIQKGAQDDAEKLVEKELLKEKVGNKEKEIQRVMLEHEASKRAAASFYPGLSEWNGEV